ncbi:MAG: acetate kinase [Bacteroidales bacterium]|nr:acetate kinase [Bacteroidales bacterium]
MIILVLNCGSSSLKYQVLDMKSENDYSLLAKGLVERIGGTMGILNHQVPDREKYSVEKPVPDHTAGISYVLEMLTDKKLGVLSSLKDIDAVGHRVAHGGEYFFRSTAIDDKAIANIEKCCELAPLHNPANLLGIRAVQSLMPEIPQVAVFDTSFHQTMPDYAYMYAIPYEYYQKYKIRRYGFHGTSHKFVAQKACDFVGMDINNSKIVTCHLGNGSSITAVKNGRSIDTSMGFTPMEGLVMGTRSGTLDAGVVTFLAEKENLTTSEINALLNKKSGLLGISQISSDMRDIESGAGSGNANAALAQEMLFYGIRKYIGSYAAAMGGLDMFVFTGGIGENSSVTREQACEGLEFLGVHFDKDINRATRGKDVLLSTSSSKVKVVAVTTNEELVIARDTMNIVKNK